MNDRDHPALTNTTQAAPPTPSWSDNPLARAAFFGALLPLCMLLAGWIIGAIKWLFS